MRPAREEDVALAMERVFALCRKLECITGRHILIAQAEQASCLAQRTDDGFSHCHAMSGAGIHVDALGRIYACSSFVGDERFLLGDVVHGIDARRQGELAREMQRTMAFCRTCTDFLRCGGACYARMAGEHAICTAECALKRAAIKEATSK